MHRIPLLLFLLYALEAYASLLAIDYGGEYIKASVIKPGVPFDVLLNRDSKRKVMSSVAFKSDSKGDLSERLFGGDAFSLTSRFPLSSFNALKVVIGRPFSEDDAQVSFFKQIAQNELISSARGTVAFVGSTSSKPKPASDSSPTEAKKPTTVNEWTTEELLAMQLSYIKDLADAVTSSTSVSKVKDCVLTVPPFFTQHERQALADAVDLAGLKLLALINDGTAVAVNYAMTRSFGSGKDGKEWHVVYDAGATSVSATVVGFSTATPSKKSSSNGNATEITVSGVAYDRSLSGMELDRRVRDLLVNAFERKHKGVALKEDKKAMAKMWKEAGRVKSILSANTQVSSSIESLTEDIDFRTSLTRDVFEDACTDLKSKWAKPIVDAIASAGLTLDDIQSVILTGGASRTPMVQNAVKQAVGEAKIATNVNADESAVLGAALYGASLSRQFKTKELKVVDIGVWDVVVGYPSSSDETRTINTLVFPAYSKVASKKTLALKRMEDFSLIMSYRNSELATREISSTKVTGVKEAMEKMKERLAEINSKEEPTIKFAVEMDKDGFARVTDAIVWADIKEEETVLGKIKGIFGGGKKEGEDEDTEQETSSTTTSSTTTVAETSTTSPTGESASGTESATSSTSSAKPTPTMSAKERSMIKLKIETTVLGIPAMSSSDRRKSRDRLIALDTGEALKRRAEEARNALEGYLYRLRDLLEGDEDTPFMECSQPEERKKLEAKMHETFAWMSEHEMASTYEILDQRDALEQIERPIQTRYSERESFPQALSDMQQAHWATRVFLQSAAENATIQAEADPELPPKYTEAELEDITTKLKASEIWLNDGVEKQKAAGERCGDSDPVLLSAELKARGSSLQRDVMKLLKRRNPVKKKTTSSASSSTTSATASGSGSATATLDTTITSAAPTETVTETQHVKDEL